MRKRDSPSDERKRRREQGGLTATREENIR